MFTKTEKHIKRVGGILLVLLILFGAVGSLTKPAQSVETGLMQFTSGGHALGFASSGIYAATGTHALRVDFVEANPVQPMADSPAGANGLLSRVTYSNLWPGISLTYDAPVGNILRSTYTLQPGADSKSIRLRYNAPLSLNKDGTLQIAFQNGNMLESAPIAWQEMGGKRVPVDVRFSLSAAGYTVAFNVGAYNPHYALTIDPGLTWNSFLGGSLDDYGRSLALDASGNVYVTGNSAAPWGCAVDCTIINYTGDYDAFVAKLDAASGALIWNSFLGGNGFDDSMGIAVDGSGNVYVTGYSAEAWGSPVRAYTGGVDGFAAKLNSSGGLIWNTFLGGSEIDRSWGVAVGGDGSVYVTGNSIAAWSCLPTDCTVRAFAGVEDAYIAKLTSSGDLTWNTFLGGGGTDVGYGITVDGSGNSYVAGYSSADWGSPVRPYSGDVDGFAAKLDSSGALTWNTFLGGSGADRSYGIDLDGSGNIYVVGSSYAAWGSPVRSYKGGLADGFAAKLTPSGALTWNTFLGGSGYDFNYGIAVDASGNAYVAGSSDATWGIPLRDYSSDLDGFAAKLTPSGVLAASAFVGGSGIDKVYGIAVFNGDQTVYVSGYSNVAWGSPARAYTSGNDTFVAKLDLTPPVVNVDDFSTPGIIAALPITIPMADKDFIYSTVASDDPLVCGTNSQGLHTIWYSYTATAFGEITADTFGSSFDSVLAIWTGTRGNLQSVACNDDSLKPGYSTQSEAKAVVMPGIKYYIEVTQFVPSVYAPEKPALDIPQGMDAVTNWMTLNVKFTPGASVKYDDKDAVWTYTGLWSNASNAKHYKGSTHQSTKIGNAASMNFVGSYFTLYYYKAMNMGNLDVFVDGAKIATINENSTVAAYQQPYTSPIFANGAHTLRLVHGTKYVNVDAIEVFTAPDTTLPAAVTNLAAVASATYTNAALTWTATGDDGLIGTAKSYQVRYSLVPIVDEATWASATAVTKNIPNPKAPGSAETMTVTGLSPGKTYYFNVRVLDDNIPTPNKSDVSNSPSAVMTFVGAAGSGTFDDKDLTKWMYSGTWTSTPAASAYGASYRVSTVIGDAAFLVFDGIKFSLTYGMNSKNGNLDVYVDDVFLARVNEYSLAQKWKQKYTSPVLSTGRHTVKFVHATGSKAEVDAIEIVGTPDTDPPQPVTNLTAAPNAATNGSIDLTWTAPAEDSVGSSPVTSYAVRYALTNIVDEAGWNAAMAVTAGLPAAPRTPGLPEFMTVSNLVPGVKYYIAVRGVDEFNNLGGIVTASAYSKAPAAAAAGKYDNKDTHWLFTSWTLQIGQPLAYLSSLNYSSVIGKTATFVFNGSGFKLIYARSTTYGGLQVWVDGVLVYTLSENGAVAWQQEYVYGAHGEPALTPGQHTVVFRHASGTRVNVDAIEILP